MSILLVITKLPQYDDRRTLPAARGQPSQADDVSLHEILKYIISIQFLVVNVKGLNRELNKMLRIPYKQTRLQVCQNMSEILRLLTRHSLVFLTAFCSLRIYLIDRTDIEAKRK